MSGDTKIQKTDNVLLGPPPKQGLYDPQFEKDACGVGFVVNMKGRKSHSLVQQALQILVNLDHRGACGCEANTGDGAGILMQMPHEFFKVATDKSGFKLPNPGQYGVGMLFMPKDPAERETVKSARAAEPFMMQVFIARNANLKNDLAFERKLYVIRKVAEQRIRYGTTIAG